MNDLIKTSLQFRIFKKHWAESCQSLRRKSTFVAHDESILDEKGREHVSNGTGLQCTPGWIQATHHLLYNIIRNVDQSRGFIQHTKPGKEDVYQLAHQQLHYLHKLATELQNPEKAPVTVYDTIDRTAAHIIKRVTTFLEPFGGSITIKQFADMDLPKYDHSCAVSAC